MKGSRFFILVSAPTKAIANASKNHFRTPPFDATAGGPVGRAGSFTLRRELSLSILLVVYGGKRKPRILSILEQSGVSARQGGAENRWTYQLGVSMEARRCVNIRKPYCLEGRLGQKSSARSKDLPSPYGIQLRTSKDGGSG